MKLEETLSSERDLKEEIAQIRNQVRKSGHICFCDCFQQSEIVKQHETEISEMHSENAQLKFTVSTKTKEIQQARDDAATAQRDLKEQIVSLQQELEHLRQGITNLWLCDCHDDLNIQQRRIMKKN